MHEGWGELISYLESNLNSPWQNNAPLSKDAHALISRACEYVRLHGRVADGVKIANQLILINGEYPGLSRWSQCNLRGL